MLEVGKIKPNFLIFLLFFCVCLISEDGKHNTSDSLKRYEASLALLGVTFEGEAYPNNMVNTNNGQRYFYQHIQIFANATLSAPLVFFTKKLDKILTFRIKNYLQSNAHTGRAFT